MHRRQFYDDDVPLDEQTQQEIIEQFELEAQAKRIFYRQAFTLALLVPTPLFIVIPSLRASPALALESLLCVVASAYGLFYSIPQILKLTLGLSVVTLLQSVVRHKGAYSLLWFVPLTSTTTALLVNSWFQQISGEIAHLKTRKFKLKGA